MPGVLTWLATNAAQPVAAMAKTAILALITVPTSFSSLRRLRMKFNRCVTRKLKK